MPTLVFLARRNIAPCESPSMVECTPGDSQRHHMWKLTHHSVLSIRCWQRGPYQPGRRTSLGQHTQTSRPGGGLVMSQASEMRSSCDNRATCCDGKVRSTDYTSYWTTESTL